MIAAKPGYGAYWAWQHADARDLANDLEDYIRTARLANKGRAYIMKLEIYQDVLWTHIRKVEARMRYESRGIRADRQQGDEHIAIAV